jgi:adenylate cyclase
MEIRRASPVQAKRGSITTSTTFLRAVTPRVLGANIVAAGIVYIYGALVSPTTGIEPGPALELTALGVYILIAASVGLVIGRRNFAPVAAWLDAGRPPTQPELELTLTQPLRQSKWVLIGWVVGGALFAGLHLTPNPYHYDPGYGLFVGAVAVLGGLAAAMLSYLVIENTLRPIFALALEQTTPVHAATLGVRQRFIVSWALGSGVVFIGIALMPFSSARLELVWLLAPVGLIAGGVIITFAARAVANPISAVREALAQVEGGDLDARVEVDDNSEIGLVQAGFNKMVAGLRERERLRSMFGTYVDPDVAEHLLKTGTSVEGEEVEATIMFLDVKDFTGFAERAPAREVVSTMNRLFERIVPIVREHGGHVDKFVGDGVLAVFGAPRRNPDHAARAVGCAVAIAKAVSEEFGETLSVGMGINTGTVIAGNIGGGGRLEFSVIGDPVNVAQRVEAATRATGDVILISQQTKDALQTSEHPFVERPGVELKGKRGAVCLYGVPVSPANSS